MADNGNNNDNVFVYMGGDQEVPEDVTHAIVDPSVDTIRRKAFFKCRHLLSIKMHDGVKFIEEIAFQRCSSLKRIKLPGVRVIEEGAFFGCTALEDVEFGDKLDTIREAAFAWTSLSSIKLPRVRIIESFAFPECKQLTGVEFSEDLETIGGGAFDECPLLEHIALPLKRINFEIDEGSGPAFDDCVNLTRVDLVGGIHKTISSLLLERWRNEMNDEIDRINQDLPNTPHYEKTAAIQQWIGRVLGKIEHYKSEHYLLLKDSMTQLELALWKSKLHEMEGEEFSLLFEFWSLCVSLEKKMTLLESARWKAKVDEEFAGARLEARVNCGATFIIPHVLSFLNDDDVFPLRRGDNEGK